MANDVNEFGQPVGVLVHPWTAPPFPHPETIEGRRSRLEPLDPASHAESLFAANALDTKGLMWTYLGCGPFPGLEEYRSWLSAQSRHNDPSFYAIVYRQTNKAVGIGSYLRIDPEHGVIEVGHLAFSPLLQGTACATEAMYLMMTRVFELGYRRYEWKCNALNAASRRAATRLGFAFEGVFRQAAVSKGRNRDTAWYSILDQEWPHLREAFQRWLDDSNFDHTGQQRVALSTLTSRERGSAGHTE
jgi:RimJ/RimL family protein N-acetyltransferase